jgi:hypothetical protein
MPIDKNSASATISFFMSSRFRFTIHPHLFKSIRCASSQIEAQQAGNR